jgi:glycosyltransferase involved in cell wall biosynthesis
MRVCIAARLAGGVGVYSQMLVRSLVAADATVDIQLATPDPVPAELLDRTRVHSVAHAGMLPTHPGWLLDALAFRRAIRPLVRDVDLIHFTDARHALFSTGLGRPTVGTMNDYFYATVGWRPGSVSRFYHDWPMRYLPYHLARAGERRALRALSCVISISDAVAEIVGRAYAVPAERFTTVRYGLDFSTIPRNAGTIGSPPTLLFVGGNFQRKGLLVLLQAFPAVLARLPDARLTVVGRSHYSRGAKRLARRLGVLDRCDFLGAVGHHSLPRYYASATVLAMPSLMEAFGIPYLEAMSCGLPVVATSCQGPDEYLLHERNALVAPPGDAAALAKALIRMLTDQPLRDRLRAGGWETSRQFTPARMANQTLAVYRSMADTAWPGPGSRQGTR